MTIKGKAYPKLKFIIFYLFTEHKFEKIFDFNKTEEIKKFLEINYSTEEVLNKIRDFYFSEYHLQSETTRLKNVCHVCSFFFITITCLIKMYTNKIIILFVLNSLINLLLLF